MRTPRSIIGCVVEDVRLIRLNGFLNWPARTTNAESTSNDIQTCLSDSRASAYSGSM
jgi:hypothetical protein